MRQQPSGVRDRKDLWEIHCDPYDVSRIWVRDHWNGGWITVFWTQLHRVAAPFGELAWDHARRRPGPARPRKNSPTRSPTCWTGPIRGPAAAGTARPELQPPGPARRRPHQGRPPARIQPGPAPAGSDRRRTGPDGGEPPGGTSPR